LLIKFCNRNNLILRYIDNEHLSAINLLNLFRHVDPAKVYMTLLIREKFASIVLTENALPIHVSVFTYEGVSELINSLAEKLESLSQKFDEVIDIEKSFVFGDAYTESTVLKIQESTGLILTSINPFSKINCSDNFQGKISSMSNLSHYTSATGIAVRLV